LPAHLSMRKGFRGLLEAFADVLNTFDFEFTKAVTDYERPIGRCTDLTAYLRKKIVKGC